MKNGVFDTYSVQNFRSKGNNREIGARIGRAENFGAELNKLTASARLRFFVSEAIIDIVKFNGQRVGTFAVLNQRSYGGCRSFGAQSERFAFFILKSVHFFLYNVCAFTDSSVEKRQLFESRGSDFREPEFGGCFFHYTLNVLPCADVGGHYIHSASRLSYRFHFGLSFCIGFNSIYNYIKILTVSQEKSAKNQPFRAGIHGNSRLDSDWPQRYSFESVFCNSILPRNLRVVPKCNRGTPHNEACLRRRAHFPTLCR